MQGKAMTFNILLEEEDGLFVAHCLELDIVATGETFHAARRDLIDLIKAQVAYAFANDNLDNLYHPAPAGVWKKLYECREESREQFHVDPEAGTFVPPWIVANTCKAETGPHA